MTMRMEKPVAPRKGARSAIVQDVLRLPSSLTSFPFAMATLVVSESRRIPAPPREVYAIIADYTEGHPHIMPSAYFRNIEVEQGGVGAGTRIRFDMTALGTTRTARADIEEPSPGQILVERDVEGRFVTTFKVNPAREGRESDVTIMTELQTRGGIFGVVERMASKALLARIYREELERLAAYAASGAGALRPTSARKAEKRK